MDREYGYYWCKIKGRWDIFHFYEVWVDNLQETMLEELFEEIDERRIVRQS